MPTLTITEHFEAPPALAFEALSDFPNAADIVTGIQKVEMLTDGPVGVGTRFRETRIMFGREASETMEVTAFDPPAGITLEAESHGTHYRSIYALSALDGGTSVAMTFEATPKTFMARLLSVVFSGMIKSMAKMMHTDLREAAQYAKQRAREQLQQAGGEG
ncbi:SRPBCC family protein [Cucumibacter marinus]|uniref:SRPBCC family protein n=1 Tax=Cucumibacter marinus TaxID=1121252 RepID=UPI000419C866|nr:SRPBCC family protein [Cucumibacter marinus]